MSDQTPTPPTPDPRPLSALLSQALVAFTVEVDNEVERLMAQSGFAGSSLSLVVWLNCLRFLANGSQSVADLARIALDQKERVRPELGCLERWNYIVFKPQRNRARSPVAPAPDPSGSRRRAGWGSGRGIRAGWIVELTAKGQRAAAVWPPSITEVEHRWLTRFGADTIGRLRGALQTLVNKVPFELPEGLPGDLLIPTPATLPKRSQPVPNTLSLAALLSQGLCAFKLEFDRHSKTSLALSANTLRVLGDQPIPVGDLAGLTGASPETCGPGWQLKPYVVIESDPNRRAGKVISLNDRGRQARHEYFRLTAHLQKVWEGRIGKETVASLRSSLESLFRQGADGRPLLSIGMSPPVGTRRAGVLAPALGRRTIGPAARQRIRAMATQNEAFVRDPANALPHYPLWDMNRGFGP